MLIEYLKNPKFINEEKTRIDCKIKFSHFQNEIPFLASKNDTEPHGREIYELLMQGKFGEIEDPFMEKTPIITETPTTTKKSRRKKT